MTTLAGIERGGEKQVGLVSLCCCVNGRPRPDSKVITKISDRGRDEQQLGQQQMGRCSSSRCPEYDTCNGENERLGGRTDRLFILQGQNGQEK